MKILFPLIILSVAFVLVGAAAYTGATALYVVAALYILFVLAGGILSLLNAAYDRAQQEQARIARGRFTPLGGFVHIDSKGHEHSYWKDV